MKRKATNGEMITTTRLAAAGIGVVTLAAALHGIHNGQKAVQRSHEIADHINHPGRIPMPDRIDVAVPHGSNASALAHELAPTNKGNEASLYGEIMNQMHDGILQGVVHVDKQLVKAQPNDVNFINPSTGEIIHPNKH